MKEEHSGKFGGTPTFGKEMARGGVRKGEVGGRKKLAGGIVLEVKSGNKSS